MKLSSFVLVLALLLVSTSNCANGNSALRIRPITEAEMAGIQHNAAFVQKNMAPMSKADFNNYSDESIEWLDDYIEHHRNHELKEKLQQVISAYVGEAIRVNFHCEWVVINEGIGMQCPGELTVLPLNKVIKQFESGHEHSVYAFYRLVPTLIKEAQDRRKGLTK